MVERLEGFCSENDWRRAYNEINDFEKVQKEINGALEQRLSRKSLFEM